jgi:hypothetical protein
MTSLHKRALYPRVNNELFWSMCLQLSWAESHGRTHCAVLLRSEQQVLGLLLPSLLWMRHRATVPDSRWVWELWEERKTRRGGESVSEPCWECRTAQLSIENGEISGPTAQPTPAVSMYPTPAQLAHWYFSFKCTLACEHGRNTMEAKLSPSPLSNGNFPLHNFMHACMHARILSISQLFTRRFQIGPPSL